MNKKRKIIVISIIGGIIILLSINSTYAKYIYNSVRDYYLNSKGFYFTSDKLDTTITNNVDNNWTGNHVYFNLYNNKNNNLITTYNINYEVSCSIEGEASNHIACYLNGTSNNKVNGVIKSTKKCFNKTNDGIDVNLYNEETCLSNNYNYDYAITNNEVYFDLVITDNNYEIKDVEVNITVNSTSPYSKTLLGKFILHKGNELNEEVSLSYTNYAKYGRLSIINSYNENKCIKVSWNSNDLRIDALGNEFTSVTEDNNNYINSIILDIEKKKEIDYIFYKTNFNNAYTANDFTLEDC